MHNTPSLYHIYILLSLVSSDVSVEKPFCSVSCTVKFLGFEAKRPSGHTQAHPETRVCPPFTFKNGQHVASLVCLLNLFAYLGIKL